MARASPPRAVIPFATSSTAALSEWPLTTTLAPSAARLSTIERPIWRQEPVTSATWPSKRKLSSVSIVICSFSQFSRNVLDRRLGRVDDQVDRGASEPARQRMANHGFGQGGGLEEQIE